MKPLSILSFLFLVTAALPISAAHAAEEKDPVEVAIQAAKDLLKCDPSGIASAKLSVSFSMMVMGSENVKEENAKAATEEMEAILAAFESAKSCADYQSVTKRTQDFIKIYEGFDLEASMNTPEGQKALKERAEAIREYESKKQ